MDSARATLARLQQQPRPPESIGDGMLLSGGVKLFMDGSGGGRTAWVYEPWYKKATEIDAGNTGYPALDPATYQQMVGLFHEAGIHVSTHAVGDRAIDWVVDTYAGVLQKQPNKRSATRHHSLQYPYRPCLGNDRTATERVRRRLPGDASSFSVVDWRHLCRHIRRKTRRAPNALQDISGERDHMWTAVRIISSLHFRLATACGLPWPVRTLNGVYGSQPFGTSESVDIQVALKSYTIWAAHQLFLENRIGSLEPGKDADIAVWDRDLYSIPSDECEEHEMRAYDAPGEGRLS